MLDERFDLGFEIAGQEVIFQQDTVHQRLVPALDLALGLRMERSAANMAHGFRFDIFGELPSDVAGPIVRQKARSVMHMRLITT